MKQRVVLWTAIVFGILVIGCSISIYASYNWIKVNQYIYDTEKLQKDEEARLVILADLHEHEFGENNHKLVKEVAKQKPDIILLDGDFLNEDSEDMDVPCKLITSLAEIAPVYFALGNHELQYAEQKEMAIEGLINELETAGATVLDKEYCDITLNGRDIRLGGMYDYAFGLDGNDSAESTLESTKSFLEDFQSTDALKIMMTHRPDSFIFGNAAEYWDVDLVIAAHNHGGQVVLPLAGGVYGGDQGWFPEYVHGMYEVGQIEMFVTSGLSSNPKILPRFNNRPEIAVLEISGK